MSGQAQWPAIASRGPRLSRPGAIPFAILSLILWLFYASSIFASAASSGSPVLAVLAGILWLGPALALGPTIALSAMTVQVGADGVRFVTKRAVEFVPYERVDAIEVDRARVRIRLKTGKIRDVSPAARRPQPAALAAFAERLKDAFERSKRARAPHPHEEELAQGGRTIADWRAELDRRASAPADYRSEPLDRDALLALVADPLAEPSARAGAAWLLRKSEDRPGERAHIRAAAEATAHPRARVVLDALADDETSEEALAEVLAGRDVRARRA